MSLFFSSEKVETYPPITVLELFTSQGCSSCPLADKLLTQIKNKDSNSQIIALSYHIDYWNYMGWKDPFSKSAFSDKQRLYSSKFNGSTMYTPQIVVNGKEHFVGSDSNKMTDRIQHHSKISAENKIEITAIESAKNKVNFSYNIFGNIKNKSLRIALVIEERSTKIARGENRNLTLKNSNIVISEVTIDLKNQNGKHGIVIPKSVIKIDVLKLVVIIENADLDIVGANEFNL